MNLDENCVFCKIIQRKIPSKIVYEDDYSIAFDDVNPQAPFHVLIVPKKHIIEIENITASDKELLGNLFFAAQTIASRNKIASNGYRLVMNNGVGAGQLVPHVHLHLMSGRKFVWPPG